MLHPLWVDRTFLVEGDRALAFARLLALEPPNHAPRRVYADVDPRTFQPRWTEITYMSAPPRMSLGPFWLDAATGSGPPVPRFHIALGLTTTGASPILQRLDFPKAQAPQPWNPRCRLVAQAGLDGGPVLHLHIYQTSAPDEYALYLGVDERPLAEQQALMASYPGWDPERC